MENRSPAGRQLVSANQAPSAQNRVLYNNSNNHSNSDNNNINNNNMNNLEYNSSNNTFGNNSINQYNSTGNLASPAVISNNNTTTNNNSTNSSNNISKATSINNKLNKLLEEDAHIKMVRTWSLCGFIVLLWR